MSLVGIEGPEDRLGEGVADDGDGVHALGLDLVEQLRGIEVPGREQDDAAAGREHRAAGEGTGTVGSEEHTSELQSLMRISYAVFCLKENTESTNRTTTQ